MYKLRFYFDLIYLKLGKKPNNFKQERPTSRHMVPRGFGLAFLACFEELDMELCEPSIRAYMEKQVLMYINKTNAYFLIPPEAKNFVT